MQLLEREQDQDNSLGPIVDSAIEKNASNASQNSFKAHRPSLKNYTKNTGTSNEVSSDVIRYGFLRKAGRGGTALSSLKPQWKTKYVELRYGKFTYEDEASHINWVSGNTNSENHNRKVISLNVDSCRCRPFKIRSPNGSSVFELTHYDGPRRLWMAGSERERDMWVTAIINAMIGSLDDQLGIGHELRLKVFLKHIEGPLDDGNGPSSSKAQDVNPNDESLNDKKPQSWDGPAAAFADDIAKFASIQSAVRMTRDSYGYHDIISKLCQKHVIVTIPVFYVKVSSSRVQGPLQQMHATLVLYIHCIILLQESI